MTTGEPGLDLRAEVRQERAELTLDDTRFVVLLNCPTEFDDKAFVVPRHLVKRRWVEPERAAHVSDQGAGVASLVHVSNSWAIKSTHRRLARAVDEIPEDLQC